MPRRITFTKTDFLTVWEDKLVRVAVTNEIRLKTQMAFNYADDPRTTESARNMHKERVKELYALTHALLWADTLTKKQMNAIYDDTIMGYAVCTYVRKNKAPPRRSPRLMKA